MTNREAYVFGWVFGLVSRAGEKKSIDLERGIVDPAARPYSANAKILIAAHRENLVTMSLNMQLAEALSEIKNIEPPMQGGSEKVQPLETRGQWYFGYYAGLGENPLAEESFDISAARRAKKLTQAQLADQMGVDQALVSRWESGKVSPNKDNLSRLKEILL